MSRISLPLLCLLAALATSCASPTARELGIDRLAPRQAEKDLSAGIQSYEDGRYAAATRLLNSALEGGLTFTKDEVAAHKYLAFIHCAAGRERSCREEFRKALRLDPELELTPAEAGHPMWGPVFRGLKGEAAKGS